MPWYVSGLTFSEALSCERCSGLRERRVWAADSEPVCFTAGKGMSSPVVNVLWAFSI